MALSLETLREQELVELSVHELCQASIVRETEIQESLRDLETVQSRQLREQVLDPLQEGLAEGVAEMCDALLHEFPLQLEESEGWRWR